MYSITKPTLLLDRQRTLGNIEKMIQQARRGNVHFRPHFKTHQSAVIGDWFRERGITAITTSSVDMALYFAGHGWTDITIAFPVNLRQIEAINELAQRVQLGLLVESAETAERLDQSLQTDVNIWLKIDIGSGRTGLRWDDLPAITQVAQTVARLPHLHLKGLLTHAGHTYKAQGVEALTRIYQEMVTRLTAVQTHLHHHGLETLISLGDTPSCSVVSNFGPIDEIRPGNFVFYDIMQYQIGACTEEEISVVVACPVVAKHANDQRIILYGGAVHLSKEAIPDENGRPIYGRIAHLNEDGWTKMINNTAVVAISQEHGIVQTADTDFFNSVAVGDLLAVLPIHSCLTANLLKKYHTLDGEIIEMAPI